MSEAGAPIVRRNGPLEPQAKEVMIQTHGHDKYTRTLGDVILPDGINVNQELVKQGWCGGIGRMRQEIQCSKS